MGFGWKDALKIGMGAGIGFATGGPAGALLGGATSARDVFTKNVGNDSKEEYEKLLDYLRGLSAAQLANKDRRAMGKAYIKDKFDKGGEPYEERHVRATLENALLDMKGDLAATFDQGGQ